MGLKLSKDQDFLLDAAASINHFILNYLNWQEIEELAYHTKFIMRNSAILKGSHFLLMSLICSKGDSHNTLEDMVDTLEKYSKIQISKQALAEKIDSSKAIDFLTSCLKKVQRKKIDYLLDDVPPEALIHFSQILLQDSSVINLHEKLSKFFKGSGGRASKSALKIDLIYDLKLKEFISFLITDMKTVDQTNSKEILEFTDENTLIIRDLGYSQICVFEKIVEKNAYFLSRFKTGYLVYLRKEDTEPIDLNLFIEKEFLTQEVLDLNVFITDKKLPVRVVVYRCPEEVINQRRRVANQTAKKQGRTVSEAHQALCQYTTYITNVPKDLWKPEIVGTIYALRWQIELIFKCWKSVCQIHVLSGTNPRRIRVLILSRLIQVSIYTAVYSIIQRYCDIILNREISMYKIFCWIKGEDEFYKILSLKVGEEEIRRLIKRSVKDQRNRNSSWENVKNEIPFDKTYGEKLCKSFLS